MSGERAEGSRAASRAPKGSAASEQSAALDEARRREQRRHPRFRAGGTIRIAPYTGPGEISWARFRECEWLDVSQGGFSFVLAEPLLWSLLVVRLGQGRNSLVRVARVVRQQLMRDGDAVHYLHGCRFEALPCPQITERAAASTPG